MEKTSGSAEGDLSDALRSPRPTSRCPEDEKQELPRNPGRRRGPLGSGPTASCKGNLYAAMVRTWTRTCVNLRQDSTRPQAITLDDDTHRTGHMCVSRGRHPQSPPTIQSAALAGRRSVQSAEFRVIAIVRSWEDVRSEATRPLPAAVPDNLVESPGSCPLR